MNPPAKPAAAAAQVTTKDGAPVFDSRDRVTILTPVYGDITEVFANSLKACSEATAYFRQPDGSVKQDTIIANVIKYPGDSHIDRARNVLTNLWVKAYEAGTGTRKAYWWDSDIELPPMLFMRLYLQTAAHGHPFVCGSYAMKCLRPTFIANVFPGTRPNPKTGLVPVRHAGTGSMMWDISVPLELRKHPRVLKYETAPNTPWPNEVWWAYFNSGPYGAPEPKTGLPQWQSEDWMVCEYWRELGHEVLLDTEVKLRHYGRLLYPPTVEEIQGAMEDLLRGNHPAINIETLREKVAQFQPPLKAAA